MPRLSTLLITGSFLLQSVKAQSTASSCSVALTASYPAPSVASSYQAKLVANKLSTPRSIIFDSEGHLLVVQSGHGITSLTLKDDGSGCMSVTSTKDVILDVTVRATI
jgi:hypothetical protein